MRRGVGAGRVVSRIYERGSDVVSLLDVWCLEFMRGDQTWCRCWMCGVSSLGEEIRCGVGAGCVVSRVYERRSVVVSVLDEWCLEFMRVDPRGEFMRGDQTLCRCWMCVTELVHSRRQTSNHIK